MGLRVILVEPKDGRNIGMAARAVANFNTLIESFWIVSTRQINQNLKRSKVEEADVYDFDFGYWKSASRLATPEGCEILKVSKVVAELHSAVQGCQKVVGFTGKEGNMLRAPVTNLRSIMSQWDNSPQTWALVFGREDRGLFVDELRWCGELCTISTGPYCTSLNLSASVTVVLSRFFEELVRPADSDIATMHLQSASAPPQIETLAEEQAEENLQEGAKASDVAVEETIEVLRQSLESVGYPVGRSRGERRSNLFAYRTAKQIAELSRFFHRDAQESELQAFERLVTMLSSPRTEQEDKSIELVD